MKHVTQIPLYIRGYDTNNTKLGSSFIEIPIGTELEFIKFGDESDVYSSDPIHAHCYSGEFNGISFSSKFLYTDSSNIYSFYNIK